jgi:LysE type translocator
MPWAAYGAFLARAIVLVVVPGPDFAVVTKNTLAAGRWRGGWAAAGVTSSNAVQGAAAAAGLGAVIVRTEPLFEAVKWAGVTRRRAQCRLASARVSSPSTPSPRPPHRLPELATAWSACGAELL